jgi:uncharacterized RDD family membrane protein YckC
MLDENNATVKQRIMELAIDYACILIYLLLLFGIGITVYLGFLSGIPDFSEQQSQLLAAFTSIIPIILIFSFLDYTKGSFGKRKAGLIVFYSHRNFGASLLRNIVKFLPWQLAHIGVIHGVYAQFDVWSIIFSYFGMGFGILLFVMGVARKDKRHLGDLIAGTQVQAR